MKVHGIWYTSRRPFSWPSGTWAFAIQLFQGVRWSRGGLFQIIAELRAHPFHFPKMRKPFPRFGNCFPKSGNCSPNRPGRPGGPGRPGHPGRPGRFGKQFPDFGDGFQIEEMVSAFLGNGRGGMMRVCSIIPSVVCKTQLEENA